METIKLENLLGKQIQEISTMLNHEVEPNLKPPNKHRNTGFHVLYEDDLDYFGKKYNSIVFSVDGKDIVTEITIHLVNADMDKSFYQAFSDNYGSANDILVIDGKNVKEQIEEQHKVKPDIISAFAKLKSGNFEHAPQMLFWNKENYQIKIWVMDKILTNRLKSFEIKFRFGEKITLYKI